MKGFVLGIFCLTWMGFIPAFAGDVSAENIVKNGDFEKGRAAWDMEPGVRIIKLAESEGKQNNVVEVELHKNRNRGLRAFLQLKSKKKNVMIRMRVKPGDDFASATPTGHQMTVRIEHSDGIAVSVAGKIKPQSVWQDVVWNFSDLEIGPQDKLLILFHPGSGRILLDDVVVTIN